MSSDSIFGTWVARGAWLVLAVSVTGGVLLISRALPRESGNGVSTAPPPTPSSFWPSEANLDGVDWTVFRNPGAVAPAAGEGLAGRYRLAGTFFEFTGDVSEIRKAILDNLMDGSQTIVEERDEIDGGRVVRIFADSIILADANGEHQLWLTFSGMRNRTGRGPGVWEGAEGGAEGGDAQTARFGGKQIGPMRWVFERQALIGYYEELMDEPERLLQVFDSLDPIYDADEKITGYYLGMEGEVEFFRGVGLQEGDVIRSVNSLQMTNRRRAEYFIHEFVQNRANAFVLDIERGGRKEKLIYEIR